MQRKRLFSREVTLESPAQLPGFLVVSVLFRGLCFALCGVGGVLSIRRRIASSRRPVSSSLSSSWSLGASDMAERKFQMKDALLNHPQEACLIGNIIARWNVVEKMLSSLFAHFTGADIWHAGLILSSLLNSRAKLDIVDSAGKYALHNDPLEKEFLVLMKELRQRLDARNYFAHSVYAINEKGRLVAMTPGFDWTEMETDKQTQKVSQYITTRQLEKELEAAHSAYQLVSGFSSLLFESAPLLPGNMQIPSAAFLRRARAQMPADQHTKEAKTPRSRKGKKPPPRSSRE